MRLHKIQKVFIDGRKLIRIAMLPEIEEHCWTMMQGHGFDDLLTSEDATNRDPPNLGDQDQMVIDQATNHVASAQIDDSQTSVNSWSHVQLEQVVSYQKHEERTCWKARQKPRDPFALIDSVSDNSTATKQYRAVLSGRIAAKPRPIDFYPHTKVYLEKTPLDSSDFLRNDAKSAMEAYKKRCETCSLQNLV